MNRRFEKQRSTLRNLLAAALVLLAINAPAQQQATGGGCRRVHRHVKQTAGTPQGMNSPWRRPSTMAPRTAWIVKNALLDYQIQEQSNRATTSQALPQITGSLGLTDNTQIPTTLIPGRLRRTTLWHFRAPSIRYAVQRQRGHHAEAGAFRRAGLCRSAGPPGFPGFLLGRNRR